VIVARWIETKGFKAPSKGGPGILSIYQPLAPGKESRPLNEATVRSLAVRAVKELEELIPDLRKEPKLKVESYRWPSSIHVVPPGYFTKVVPKLTPPVGRVSFAGNNLGRRASRRRCSGAARPRRRPARSSVAPVADAEEAFAR
jgi:monoamine oxidase